VCFGKVISDSQVVQAGRATHVDTIVPRLNTATKTQLLQIEEARCALYVGELIYGLLLKPFKLLATDQTPAEFLNERFKMVFDDTVEIHQFTVYIVDYFCLGWVFHEEQRSSSTEWLDVGLVFGKQRKDEFSESAFSADPWDDWFAQEALRYLTLAGVLVWGAWLSGYSWHRNGCI